MAADEPKNEGFASYLQADEQVSYTGHGNTGSVFGAALSILSPILGGLLGKKEPLKQWRVAVTDRRVLLIRRDSKEEQSAHFDKLSQIELKRSSGVNRTLILRSDEADDLEIGLPTARNDYEALEQALRQAAPQLMGG